MMLNKKQTKQKFQAFTTVTPLSKTLAMILFILFPFIGFFLGTRYQYALDRITITPLPKISVTPAQKTQKHPNMIVITRQADKRDNLPELAKTITDTVTVERLYDEVASLPDVAKDGLPTSCPARQFQHYYLDFYQENQRIVSADLSPTGCRTVRMDNGTVKNVLTDQGRIFINDLQHVLQLSDLNFFGSQNGTPLYRKETIENSF